MLQLRRLALLLSGLTFAVIALASLVAPRLVAPQYAFSLEAPGALNQFRAVFTGFWAGLAWLMLSSARSRELERTGTFAGILIGLQALARVASLVLDGVPPPTFLAATGAELVTAALILAPVVASPSRAAAPHPES